jgi:predicted DCC family thiol-disulfide oxidoreductase YuxK
MNNNLWPLTLYYDGACQMCRAEMRNLEVRDAQGLLCFIDISQPGFAAYPPGTDRPAMMALLHGQRADGSILRGVEVFRLAYTAVGLPWVARLTRLPGLKAFCEAIYPVIARNRYRLPTAPIRWLFEVSLRRAAERSAERMHCTDGQCRIAAPSAAETVNVKEK